MTTVGQENARMLASLLGIEEADAAERLDKTVLVTVAPGFAVAGSEVSELLERTIRVVRSDEGKPDLELVIGSVEPATSGPHLFASLNQRGVTIDAASLRHSNEYVHPLLKALAACHIAAASLHRVIGSSSLPRLGLPLSVDFAELGIPERGLATPFDISGAVLVGGGAVGNGFLRALRHLQVRGTLPIVDPKVVGEGNPNRCLYFTGDHVGLPKAPTLAQAAQRDFPALKLEAHACTFGELVAKTGPVDTAIVTVDSRRARRSLQKEIPRRVVDASTTDARAVIVHSHSQPTDDACLACIYRHVPDEHARERSIAEGLGIDIETVREGFISADAAARIAKAHFSVEANTIIGKAYDTLFKELCSVQALLTPEGRQVLAPFAFVSALAGVLLVVELLRSNHQAATTNYWTVDPWGAPISRLRRLRPRVPDCEFCADDDARSVAHSLWSRRGEVR
ncbi:ThiF family adenylyltransferase [Rhizobium leucaenae]|uniref:ThiF family adenylyltransferase n=1 Tax=Rhizobium leucaenae TaxID=29450 RepID=UPI00162089D3|nr:ThiF family adenylyltransferase [Rhizobium leucaenae]MBB6305599.1 molybdopterin/thiamine biosynthesis adenylyltransferase [Rhizobium leucaenae]